MSDPAHRIITAFSELPAATQEALADVLRSDQSQFIRDLGFALTLRPELSVLSLQRALHIARFNRASAALVESLGDDEPWLTVRECLRESLNAPDPLLEVWSDEPA